MNIENIYQSWGDILTVNGYEEFMSLSSEDLTKQLIDRNLILIRGLPPTLSDPEFYALGGKFGRVWTQEDYRKWFITKGSDPTIDRKTDTPVSYFDTTRHMFKDSYMGYHADMAHIRELSYPGRVLYMVDNTLDGSGDTTWLNLEHGWSQMSPDEQAQFAGYEVVFHDFYVPGTRMETFPFLKTNPKTGRVSPRINCFSMPNAPKAWIHHVIKDGVDLDYIQSGSVICELYDTLETKSDTVYTHHWQEGDMIVYDNWFNVHKREKVNGKRLLKRLTYNLL
jgi:alpha-ketoglutarate-dependent taurine dioxygenase